MDCQVSFDDISIQISIWFDDTLVIIWINLDFQDSTDSS